MKKNKILYSHLNLQPPELEILEIGELGNDKFRGIFKLNYAGDAYIEVQTKVQVTKKKIFFFSYA